jgi:hypothetical protein
MSIDGNLGNFPIRHFVYVPELKRCRSRQGEVTSSCCKMLAPIWSKSIQAVASKKKRLVYGPESAFRDVYAATSSRALSRMIRFTLF